MGERLRHFGNVVGCAAIVVAAAVTLGLSVDHDLRFTASATTPKSIAANHGVTQQLECIYNAIRSHVPKGAAVYVDGKLWTHQRLSELSTLWAVPQPNRADARWWITLVPARGQCDGLALKVSRK